MATPPEPYLLVSSVMGRTEAHVQTAVDSLVEHLGSLCYVSEALPFDWTDYYGAELGPSPGRRLVAFEDTVDPSRLAEIKRLTCRLEVTLSRPGGRASREVNLDPGVMSEHQLLLASTKPRAHRVYLGKGIYGDLMLIWRGGDFKPLEWTYPDYADPRLRGILTRLRGMHLARRRQATGATP